MTLECHIEGDPLTNFTWLKGNDSESIEHLQEHSSVKRINETLVVSTLVFESVFRRDNGTYTCQAVDYNDVISASQSLFVIDKPQVNIDFMKAVGAHMIYLNWTVNDGNEPIKTYLIQHMKNGSDEWQFYAEEIGGGNLSYVLRGLEKGAAYQLRISATNAIGRSQIQTDPRWITTLTKGQTIFNKFTFITMITVVSTSTFIFQIRYSFRLFPSTVLPIAQ